MSVKLRENGPYSQTTNLHKYVLNLIQYKRYEVALSK